MQGYIPGPEATSTIAALAEKLRLRNKKLVYLLDRKSFLFFLLFKLVAHARGCLFVCSRVTQKLHIAPTAVLGDSGKLYVSSEVVPIYRSLLPQATIITPNWFDVE